MKRYRHLLCVFLVGFLMAPVVEAQEQDRLLVLVGDELRALRNMAKGGTRLKTQLPVGKTILEKGTLGAVLVTTQDGITIWRYRHKKDRNLIKINGLPDEMDNLEKVLEDPRFQGMIAARDRLGPSDFLLTRNRHPVASAIAEDALRLRPLPHRAEADLPARLPPPTLRGAPHRP